MGREACCFLHYSGSGARGEASTLSKCPHCRPSPAVGQVACLGQGQRLWTALAEEAPRLDPPSSLFLIFLPSWASSLSPGTQSCPKEIHSARQSHSIGSRAGPSLPSPSICVSEVLRRAVHRTWLLALVLPIGLSVRIPSSCHQPFIS